MNFNQLRFGIVILAVLAAAAAATRAQNQRTIWDGVYTDAQAKRGEDTYAKACAKCHAEDLLGSTNAPALVGQPFFARFDRTSADDVLDVIRRTMPQEAPDTLSMAAYADIVSYLRMDAGCHPDDPKLSALVGELSSAYPGDVGVVVALLLNQVTLAPGEAIFMPAGNLHMYLQGTGVEIMAASDNVLRGGLTPKHMDVPELLRVLRFEALPDPVLRPEPVAAGVVGWPVPVAEFGLHRVRLDAGLLLNAADDFQAERVREVAQRFVGGDQLAVPGGDLFQRRPALVVGLPQPGNVLVRSPVVVGGVLRGDPLQLVADRRHHLDGLGDAQPDVRVDALAVVVMMVVVMVAVLILLRLQFAAHLLAERDEPFEQ